MMSMATTRQDIPLLKRVCKLLLQANPRIYIYICLYLSPSLSLSLILYYTISYYIIF